MSTPATAAPEPVPLTSLSHGAGCGCKLPVADLMPLLRTLPRSTDPRLLVGNETADDAGVVLVRPDLALVQTVDFFTPIVDDARVWGRIAAANAVSDVYAMGGRPLFALNIVAWNTSELGMELLGDVLAGGQDIAGRAGFAIVGGHTIDDPEPKYGLAVIGEVHPDRVLTNGGLRPGQDLVLSKPLGVGIVTTGVKAQAASREQEDAAVASMTRLNDVAAQVAVAAGATGCTDVTGFGLSGHLGRMATESGVVATIDVDALPLLAGVRELAAAGVVPGGTRRNLAWALSFLDPGSRDEVDQLIVADAQTSGGLVFGVDPERTADVVAELTASGHDAAHIGTVGRVVAAPGDPAVRLH